MYVKELEEIGFTPREIKVYVALLEIGESSAGKIIKKSGVPGSKIYETLEKLKLKGAVSSIIKQNKSFFRASSPDRILKLMDEQRKKIKEEAIPKLKLLENKPKEKRDATLYEGVKGLRSIYDLMLKENTTIYALGVPNDAFEKMSGFIEEFTKQRIKKKIKLKIIYHTEAEKHGEKRKKMKFSQVRYLSPSLPAPAWIDIFGDYVAIFDIDNLSAVLIKNKNTANSFLNFFEMVWKQSK